MRAQRGVRARGRWAVVTAAATVTVSVLSACGSSGSTAAVPGANDNTTSASAAGLPAAPACDNPGPVQLDGKLPDKPDPSISGTVTLWGWYNLAPKSTMDLLAKYYPNVKVNFVDYALTDTLSKLQTSLNAGSGAPDMAMVEDKSLPVVWQKGLYDLSKCVNPYEQDFPAFKWARIKRPDGEVTAVPWEINPGIVTYRRDVLAKYGIAPDSIKTWADFVKAGKEVTAKSNGAVKWTESNVVDAGNGTENVLGDLELMVNQQGGKLFDDNGKVAFDNPETKKALDLLKSFRDEKITVNDVASKQAELNDLRDGKIATFITESSSRFFLSDALKDTSGKWGIMPLPAFTDGGTRGAVNGGTSIVMPDQGKNTPAAWAFLKIWLFAVDGRYDSFKAGQLVENLFLPASTDPRFQQPDPFYGGDKFLQISIDAAKAAPPFPSGATLPQLETSIVTQMPDFLSGKFDAAKLASTAADAAK